jgi:prefoldin subunit 5
MAMSARDVMANEMITLNNENTNITIRLEKANSAAAAEYGAKIAALTEELNERTSSKHELSREMELLRKENHMLSVELEEARSLVIASVHDEIKQEQLVQDIRNSENEEQVLEMERLRNENGRLHESMNEMKNLVSTLMNKLSEESASLKDARESYEQQGEELNVEKMANTYLRDEVESISAEREEAYDACKVLQQEINLLRQKCAKLDERFDSDDSIPSSDDNSKEDKLSELTKVTDTLMKELHQKNEALQAVQSVLKSLKEEQSIIKKTITELRTENAELRDTTSTSKTTSLPPLVPPPPPKSTLQHKASLDSSSSDSSIQSQIIHLEVRLKKVEKENKGLREANNIMSTKLFDEMEKTESLKIANEGLGARICKLVKYIQQNSGGASNGGSCGGEGGASTVGTSISSGKTR